MNGSESSPSGGSGTAGRPVLCSPPTNLVQMFCREHGDKHAYPVRYGISEKGTAMRLRVGADVQGNPQEHNATRGEAECMMLDEPSLSTWFACIRHIVQCRTGRAAGGPFGKITRDAKSHAATELGLLLSRWTCGRGVQDGKGLV